MNKMRKGADLTFSTLLIISAGLICQSVCQDAPPPPSSPRIMLYSLFNWGEVNGNVTFAHIFKDGKNITIVDISIERLESNTTNYDWSIHEWPVRYDQPDRCSGTNTGKVLINLSKELGVVTIPSQTSLTFETDKLPIFGDQSIFSRSLVIKGPQGTSCSNINGVGGDETFESRFYTPMAGSIWLRTWNWEISNSHGTENDTIKLSGTQSVLYSDVFNSYNREPKSSDHDWLLFVTDILDTADYGVACNHLARVYDPQGREVCDQKGCPEGMFGERFGSLRVGSKRSRFSRKIYVSSQLNLPDLSGPRDLFIGVMDVLNPDSVWGCARVRRVRSKEAHALFNNDGVTGKINLQQSSPFAPTELTLFLGGLQARAEGFQVHEIPFKAPQSKNENSCSMTLGMYNPENLEDTEDLEPGVHSHNKYAIGDLSGKHGQLIDVDHIDATVTDFNLPIFGAHSVIGRSILIKKPNSTTWICGNIRNTRPVVRAAVVFRYPIVGELYMEQEELDPFEDTTVYIGPLVYSDGNHNTTSDHEFRIHFDPPGRDYFNWTGRCLSAGKRFNPYNIAVTEKVYRDCGPKMPERCELGDMVGRNGPLNLAGTIQRADSTKRVVTDVNLPLQGKYTIVGHSMVISDKHAPKHRGDRMACARISQRFRHKGVVHQWLSKEGSGDVRGKVEFVQESPYDITNTEVKLNGLNSEAKNYSVNMVQVEHGLQFPCTTSAIYGRYNPLHVTEGSAPPPLEGTHDMYDIGDLSGKYGDLTFAPSRDGSYNDTNLPLFGYTSVMGRSVVVYRNEEEETRWFCGNIEWGYSPDEATQVSAIASFHNPNGYAWGYIRFRQLIYKDGSFGETFMEVKLRHPGVNNRNVTRGHNWSVYVNGVGVDAGVKFYQSRCVAAGYRWNPYLIHLAKPNAREYYDKECTPQFPLRCEVGDISGRHGPIVIGDKKMVFVDSNLPLAGEQSAMNRAVVIHNDQGRVERYACANILPDDDIIKWANIKLTTRFSVPNFMKLMREIMGCPDWFLQYDVSTVTETTDGECVSFLLHFTGPFARQLELAFTSLLAGGILDKPVVTTPGVVPDPKRKTKVSFRSCGGLGEDDLVDNSNDRWWQVFDTNVSSGGISPPTSKLLPVITLLVTLVHTFR